MNPNSGKGSLPTSSSSGAWKAEDLVDDKFPVGLRVLAVDDNQTCLLTLEKMLMSCLYEGALKIFMFFWKLCLSSSFNSLNL